MGIGVPLGGSIVIDEEGDCVADLRRLNNMLRLFSSSFVRFR